MIVFRKNTPSFYSIENVFGALLPHLNAEVVELAHESKGLFNRLKNIQGLFCYKTSFLHITGNDHYLLWYPFKNAILTIHDIEALKRKSGFKRWIFKKLWFDWPISNAAAITTISEFSKKEILSLGNYKTPVEVIYNPLTLPLKFSPKQFNTNETRILHVGTKKNKNIFRTIEALRGLSCQLTIIGNPDSESLSLMKTYLIDYTVKTNLSNEQMMEEYYSCDLVSFVSTYEGFGLPIIEAQAAGRVVLSSNCSSMPEVAGNGALLVDPFSVDAIRAGIISIIASYTLRQELIIAGLENVIRFRPDIIAKQYNKLYDQLS